MGGKAARVEDRQPRIDPQDSHGRGPRRQVGAVRKPARDRRGIRFHPVAIGNSRMTNSSTSRPAPYAITIRAHGGPEVLETQVITPDAPGPGQVLLRHTAIGVNFIDTYVRTGLYPAPLPSGLGNEAAGVVMAVGAGVKGFKVGDRAAYCTAARGAYATHRVVDQDLLVAIPDGISDEQAAAGLLKGGTAEYLIERCAWVR